MRRPFTNVPTRYFDDDWVFRPGDEVVVILSDDGHFVGPLVWPVSGRVTVSDDFVQVGKSQARIRNQSAKRSATDAASSFSEAIFVKNQDGEFSLFGVS